MNLLGQRKGCVTLRYLVTGDSHTTISASYRISQASISRIISETSGVLWDVMIEHGYLKPPQSEEEWRRIADCFQKVWNFPHCVGSIDGKHVVMQAPGNSGSLYFNYKKQFSIVLLALCNATYEFVLVDIGEAGRQSDRGVFANSNLGFAITNNLLKLPEAETLAGFDNTFPYVFVADDAFPMQHNLIKPYSNPNLTHGQKITNYRISRAKRIIENTFRIMAARFRIFRRPIVAKVETVESITKACVGLHNYLMEDRFADDNTYCLPGFVDSPHSGDEWRKEIPGDNGFIPLTRTGSNNYTRDAKRVRNLFSAYFNSSDGAVPWQNEMI